MRQNKDSEKLVLGSVHIQLSCKYTYSCENAHLDSHFHIRPWGSLIDVKLDILDASLVKPDACEKH